MTSLRPSPQQAAAELLARRRARTSLLGFVEYTTPRWKAGPIHREICAALDDVVAGKCDRLMLLCPPQHGKSTITSKRLSAYILGHDPTQEVISVSATSDLATEFGADIRDCIRSPEYQMLFPKTNLREDSRAKGRWQTDQGGGYFAVGVGGSIYGRGGMAIIDDPFGSWADAQSDTARRHVWEWYTGSLYNRIHPKKPIIVIQHRMHEQDLVGSLLKTEKSGGDKWRVVNLPASLMSPPWPERYDSAALQRIQENMDSRKWSALYMQDPTPEDGDYFRSDWWRYYDSPPTSLTVYMSGDFAVTQDDGDFTELAVWGVDHLGNVFALDWFSGQVSSDIWTERLVSMMQRWKPAAFIGEGGPIRRSVEPFLKRRMNDTRTFAVLEWLTGGGDKSANARSFQALMASGKVYYPHTDWAESVKSQLLKFPGGANDDKVDACSLFGRHIDSVWDAQRPPQQPAAPDWNQPLQIKDLFRKRA